MTLGEKLGKLRIAKKLSQKEVAEKIGVHLNTYSRIERGINNANPQTIEKLAELLGCEKSYLTEGNDAPAKKAAAKKETEAKKAAPAKKEAEAKKTAPAKKETKQAAPAKKETKQAAPAKKETKQARPEKKTSAEETKPASLTVNIELQYAGKSISYTDLINRAKEVSGSDGKDLNIYVKPEENRAYYVVNGQPGSFEI